MKSLATLASGLAAAIHLSAAPVGMLSLSSPDFRAGGALPEHVVLNMAGCSGGNASPALQWSHVPAGTRSFAITLFDVDEKATPSGWWHWIVYDIPATTRKLEAGAGTERSARLPAGTIQGRSDLGNAAYHGPCPAKGDPPHRYLFTIYALSVPKLDVPAQASGAMVTFSAHEHTLAKAELIGRYGR